MEVHHHRPGRPAGPTGPAPAGDQHRPGATPRRLTVELGVAPFDVRHRGRKPKPVGWTAMDGPARAGQPSTVTDAARSWQRQPGHRSSPAPRMRGRRATSGCRTEQTPTPGRPTPNLPTQARTAEQVHSVASQRRPQQSPNSVLQDNNSHGPRSRRRRPEQRSRHDRCAPDPPDRLTGDTRDTPLDRHTVRLRTNLRGSHQASASPAIEQPTVHRTRRRVQHAQPPTKFRI